MRAEERRRSDRVSLLSAIRVTGADPTGETFSEEARTVLVTLHGAAILVKRRLLPEHQLTIRSYGTGNEAKVRVVGQIEGQPEGGLYGVKFLHPDVNPWDIRFPPLAASEDAVVRLLFQCAACQARELVYLDELEAEVFGANQGLSRNCATCGGATLWKETPHELTAEGEPSTFPAEVVQPPSGLVPRTRNDRRHIRLKVKFNACVRHAELGEEVVVCENVSRGGGGGHGLSRLVLLGLCRGDRRAATSSDRAQYLALHVALDDVQLQEQNPPSPWSHLCWVRRPHRSKISV